MNYPGNSGRKSPLPMHLRRSFVSFAWAAALMLALSPALPVAQAATSSVVSLKGSIAPVPAAPPAGEKNPRHPFVSRSTLQQAEVAAEMEFEVALKMRNFDELQRRVQSGERISRAEMM